MKAHPKPQKTKTPPSHYSSKLVHKSIDATLKLIGFIGLYFYSLLEPLYGAGTSNFKNTTKNSPQNPRDSPGPRIKPRKRNNFLRHRHWKVGKYPPWKLTGTLLKIFIIIRIATHSIEDLHRTDLNRKLYNLVHNTKFVNQRGNAFPIKADTMIRNRRKIFSLNKREHRKRKKLKNKFLEGVFYLLNLRFLPRIVKNIIVKIAKALTFFVKHIDSPNMSHTAQGPRTHCPICTIPVIGVMYFLKKNLTNMTNATLVAATNYFYIKTITINALGTIPIVIMKTVTLLTAPFKRMKFGKVGGSPPRTGHRVGPRTPQGRRTRRRLRARNSFPV